MLETNLEKIKKELEKSDIDLQIEAVKHLNNWLIEKIKAIQKEFDNRLEKLNSK